MAGLIASLASGNIEKLLDTQVSRRGLWMSAAAIAAISGATYGVLTWEPSSAPVGAGSSPVPAATMRKVLTAVAERAERAKRVIGAAKLLALKSGSVKNKAGLDAAASASMKKELAEAQAEALKEAGVTASQAAAAWRHFSAVYEASLAADEDDEEDDEDDEGRGRGRGGAAQGRRGGPLPMAAMGRACERAVPEAFLALQDELEEMGVADMPPQQRQQAIVGRVQRVQPAVVAHGEERMKAEFGLSRTEIGAHLARLQAVDPKIGERSNAALQGFQASMQREMQALVSTMGLG
ncbi:hypothetical protein FNF31_00032 [Cafeteria roenbergensis]|uniref:Uncharacterized protein n=1 Tax=Cafeteria roenbergensis TaxID=33653 RepID=A0A5A8DYP7_CAFRO|nr:hypothetical protein FNF31_00032 [Cafeteria roenbergensis]